MMGLNIRARSSIHLSTRIDGERNIGYTRWPRVIQRCSLTGRCCIGRRLHPHVHFTFLGFTFRPRKALSKTRRIFTSFLPGASTDAMKKMRQAVRGWKLNRQTQVGLAALAQLYNPIIQGWWNYYGAFYPTAMLHVYRHIDCALERWARRKYN